MSSESTGDESRFREMIRDIRGYFEKRLELFFLTLTERVTFILADALQRVVGILILAGGLMFAWFAFSFLLSEWIGSYALGFLLGSLPLIAAGFIFMLLQPAFITRKIQAGMIRQFLATFDNILNSEEDGEQPPTGKNREKE